MYGYRKFPRSLQRDEYSCGARSAYMILKHFEIPVTYPELKKKLGTNADDGTASTSLRDTLRAYGLRVPVPVARTKKDLRHCLKNGGVALASVDGDHYAVIHAMKKDGSVYIADPSLVRSFRRKHSPKKFSERWDAWAIVVYPAAG